MVHSPDIRLSNSGFTIIQQILIYNDYLSFLFVLFHYFFQAKETSELRHIINELRKFDSLVSINVTNFDV